MSFFRSMCKAVVYGSGVAAAIVAAPVTLSVATVATVVAVGAGGIASKKVVSAASDAIEEKGRRKGKIEGYVEASNEYEKKLLDQAVEFLKQKGNYDGILKEKEELLDEYETYIEEMEARIEALTAEQRRTLNQMKAMQSRLKNYEVN